MLALRVLMILSLGLSATACAKRREPPAPRTDTKDAPAAPAEAAPDDGFIVTADSFADLRVLRYRVPSFEQLSTQQKLLLYYLQEAALSGRDITYDQNYEHNLLVRRALEAVVRSYPGDKSEPAFGALLTYLKRVWFSNGIHHHYSAKKFIPEGLTPADLGRFLAAADAKQLPLEAGETVAALTQKLTPILFDPKVAPTRVNKDPASDPVRDSANHFYVGLTRAEVESYTKQRKGPESARPVSVGLNSQLVKRADGTIEERPWRVGGMYGAALEKSVGWLEKASRVAETKEQREALLKLIAYYTTGSLEDWDRFCVAWVADTTSRVDFVHGFIETYGDPLDLRGTFEAMIQLEDDKATRRIRALSKAAQWFEDHSPIASNYKKANVIGVSARAVDAVLAVGDSAPPMPSGINLPNSRWIREQHGSKSVTLSNILAAYEAANRDNGSLEEFAGGVREAERARLYGGLAQSVLVDMHEVIGHASGKLAPGVRDPGETLGHYASALEEGRADLVALYYVLDPKLIELKVVPSLEVGRAAYDAFIRGALLVQLARIKPGEQIEEAHMRDRYTIASWVFARGEKDNVISRVSRDGKTFFVVNDYVKLRALFGELLKEVQRILSEGDFEAGKKLVESYGVKVDPALHQEVLKRYAKLAIAPYAGFMQPELVPVMQDDDVVDVRIEYPTDFTEQHLRYSERYSFLPTHN